MQRSFLTLCALSKPRRQGRISVLRPLRHDTRARPLQRLSNSASAAFRMPVSPAPRQFFIQGQTRDGRTFRPSDWAERLAGAMSSFRPGMRGGIAAHIGFSPYCVPTLQSGVKCVIVSEALRDLEPMAWDFVMNFARDNDLPIGEVCLLPEAQAAAGEPSLEPSPRGRGG
jgi:hypothetical protein